MKGGGLQFLIAGVGGQGTILASDILAEVGLHLGYDVKKSDILGLAVRGGSVVSHIKWDQKTHSPIIEEGEADYLIGFEWLETLRRLCYVSSEGIILVNDHRIDPMSVCIGDSEYPQRDKTLSLLEGAVKRVHIVPGTQTAIEIGTARAFNIVVLGALSKLMKESETEEWIKVMEEKIPPKMLDINKEAFIRGRNLL